MCSLPWHSHHAGEWILSISEQNIIIVIKCSSTMKVCVMFCLEWIETHHCSFNVSTSTLLISTWTTRNDFSHIEDKKGQEDFWYGSDTIRSQIGQRQNNLQSRGIEHDVIMILENVVESLEKIIVVRTLEIQCNWFSMCSARTRCTKMDCVWRWPRSNNQIFRDNIQNPWSKMDIRWIQNPSLMYFVDRQTHKSRSNPANMKGFNNFFECRNLRDVKKCKKEMQITSRDFHITHWTWWQLFLKISWLILIVFSTHPDLRGDRFWIVQFDSRIFQNDTFSCAHGVARNCEKQCNYLSSVTWCSSVVRVFSSFDILSMNLEPEFDWGVCHSREDDICCQGPVCQLSRSANASAEMDFSLHPSILKQPTNATWRDEAQHSVRDLPRARLICAFCAGNDTCRCFCLGRFICRHKVKWWWEIAVAKSLYTAGATSIFECSRRSSMTRETFANYFRAIHMSHWWWLLFFWYLAN